jgi:PiT family inorganic phosphate transporter
MHFFENWSLGAVDWSSLPLTIWLLIALALAFDFLNGLHDAANSIATVVSTRVLTPGVAVLWAAFFNFVAFLVFPLKVATTIQADVVDPAVVQPIVQPFIASTLIAACSWNLLTWYWGLPTSSSHALIGGMVGAVLAATGGDWHALRPGGLGYIILFIVLAPLIGWLLGTMLAILVTWLLRKATPRWVDSFFRRGQLLSAAFFSLGHGGNDAQKTMGIIFVLLLGSGQLRTPENSSPAPTVASTPSDQAGQHQSRPTATPKVPTEVVLACHLAMGLGTVFGGWRIVKTMGQRIIKLRPVDGFCAETAAALTLAATTSIKGIPISTTHTITGAIIGVGSVKRFGAVRWGVAQQVIWAWVLTIPGSALMAAMCWYALRSIS